MKTKRIINNLITITLLLGVMVNFTSCGPDDDDNQPTSTSNPDSPVVTNPLVGAWQLQDDEIIYNLKANGRGYAEEFIYENGKKVVQDEWPLSYVYNESTKALTITEWFDENDITEYTVQNISSTNLVVYNKSREKIETYTKVDRRDIVSNSNIVGTWRLDYGSEGYKLYIFNQDRGGVYQDWGYDKNGNKELQDEMGITFAYSGENDWLTIVEDDNDLFLFNIVSLTPSRLVIKRVGAPISQAETYIKQ